MLKNFLFVKLLKRKLLPSLKSFATLSRLHLAHFARLLLKPGFQASLNGSTKISNILKSASISDFVAHILKQKRLFVSQERSNTEAPIIMDLPTQGAQAWLAMLNQSLKAKLLKRKSFLFSSSFVAHSQHHTPPFALWSLINIFHISSNKLMNVLNQLIIA